MVDVIYANALLMRQSDPPPILPVDATNVIVFDPGGIEKKSEVVITTPAATLERVGPAATFVTELRNVSISTYSPEAMFAQPGCASSNWNTSFGVTLVFVNVNARFAPDPL
jgi:hypothetical protein